MTQLNNMGDAVARTGSEMLESATTFRKNGFNDQDSAQLATIASKFQNVADEAISAGEAADIMIAQMVAFNIEASEAESIIDIINQVSNEFSVSSGDLAGSLGLVSSTSAAMGNTLEETVAMMTGITEQTRSANRSARGLNSI